MDWPSCGGRLRQHHDAGAAIGLIRRLQTRTHFREGELDDLGARLEQHDILERNVRTSAMPHISSM
jgi:hypothetical protein